MASNVIASLVVKLTADYAELVKGMDGVKTRLDGIEKDAKRAAAGMDAMDAAGARVGRALAGYFSLAAIGSAIKQTIEYGSTLRNLAAQTGANVQGLHELGSMAKLAGSDVGSVAAALTQMNNRLADGTADAAISAIGLSVLKIRNMDPVEQFTSIAEAIGSIADPAKRTQAAMDIFGRGGATLLPIMTRNIRETRNEMTEFGDEMVDASQKAGDAITRFGSQINLVMGAALVGADKVIARWKLLNAMHGPGQFFATLPDIPDAPEKVWGGPPPAVIASAREFLEIEKQTAETAAKLNAQFEAQRKLYDQLFGVDVTNKAKEYMAAIGGVEKVAGMTWTQQEHVNDVLGKALAIYEQSGRGASAAAVGLREYLTALEAVQKAATLPSKPLNLGETLMLLPQVTQATSLYEIELAKGMQTTEQFLAEQDAFIAGLDEEATAFFATQAPIDAHTAGVNASAQAVGLLSAALTIAVPKLFDYSSAYEKAGLFVHKYSLGGMAPQKNAAGEYDLRSGISSFQHGGAGDFGSGTLAMLHGKEAIIPLDRMGRGGGGGGVTNITIAPGAIQIDGRALGSAADAAAASDRLLTGITAALSSRGLRVN